MASPLIFLISIDDMFFTGICCRALAPKSFEPVNTVSRGGGVCVGGRLRLKYFWLGIIFSKVFLSLAPAVLCRRLLETPPQLNPRWRVLEGSV